MRYLIIPPPVQLKNLANDDLLLDETGAVSKPWTMHTFFVQWLAPTKHMGKGRSGAKAVKRLDKVFKTTAVGKVAILDEGDWDKLIKAIDESEFPMIVASQLTDFMDAIVAATEEPPLTGPASTA